jgi:hypothetical protein
MLSEIGQIMLVICEASTNYVLPFVVVMVHAGMGKKNTIMTYLKRCNKNNQATIS